MLGDMQSEMSQKSKTQKIMETGHTTGWTSEMHDIAESFLRHRLLLCTLLKLRDIVPNPGYMILQRDFEQNIWNKLRDGE